MNQANLLQQWRKFAMLHNKKKFSTLLAIISLFTLVGCDDDEMRYPNNYDETIFNGNVSKKPETAMDTFKQYYQSLTNDDAIYEKAINKVLTLLSDNVHDMKDGDGSATYHVINDTNNKVSVADKYDADNAHKLADDVNTNLLTRSKESMRSAALGGSYEDDNLWDEEAYAKNLEQTYYYLQGDYKITTENLNKFLLTNSMEYEDMYSTSNSSAYEKYMSMELYDDMKINYLTSEYIYEQSYSSIGNTNARKVEVITIADRSDEIGDAKALLDEYYKAYIDVENKADTGFDLLSKLWKGITCPALAYLYGTGNEITFTTTNDTYTYTLSDPSYKEDVKAFFARYLVTLNDDGSVSIGENSEVLSAKEANWLKNTVKSDVYDGDKITSSGTLIGNVMVDVKKIRQGEENWHMIDSSLESTYTGTYTYPISVGIRMAIDDVVSRNLLTQGTYLKSAGISSLPSGLTDRIFSPKVTTDYDTVNNMKTTPGLKSDLTVYKKDGYRYMTVADTISSDSSDIFYYDATSKTYYITRMLDVVDSSALNKDKASTSIYHTAEQQEQIAREVAYEMSTTGSYKTDACVYWLSRLDFTYYDEDFLEYMKSNYKDVFKTENPYADQEKIDLNKLK